MCKVKSWRLTLCFHISSFTDNFYTSAITNFFFHLNCLYKMNQRLNISVMCQWQVSNASILWPSKGSELSFQWTEWCRSQTHIWSHDHTPTTTTDGRLIRHLAIARGGCYDPQLCPHFQIWQTLLNFNIKRTLCHLEQPITQSPSQCHIQVLSHVLPNTPNPFM